MSYEINTNALFKNSWVVFKENWAQFLGIVFIAFAIGIVPVVFKSIAAGNSLAIFIINVTFAIPQIVIGMGAIKFTIETCKGNNPEFASIFTQYHSFWQYLIASMLFAAIVSVGAIFLLIPGIYLFLRLQFCLYLVVDKKLNAFDAVKESFAITKGYALDLFLLLLVVMVLNVIAGMTVVAAFVVLPITMILYASVYNGLVGAKE